VRGACARLAQAQEASLGGGGVVGREQNGQASIVIMVDAFLIEEMKEATFLGAGCVVCAGG
jgi:hypothetical protein